jgi:hypothetical protein
MIDLIDGMSRIYSLVWLVLGVMPSRGAEALTANYYQMDPQSHLGKEVRLRVRKLVPQSKFTVVDPEFVWMEATTGSAKKEEGKIFLRVPKEQSALLSKMVDGVGKSGAGKLVTGRFHNQENGAILPEAIAKEVPFYIQVGEKGKSKNSEKSLGSMETASGSLVVAPPARSAPSVPAATVAPARPKTAVAARPMVMGPCFVLCRPAMGQPIEVRTAQTAANKEGVWEVVGMDGKLALLGRDLVEGILPIASEKDPASVEQAGSALEKYAEMEKRNPETVNLLAGEKGRWEKLSQLTVASTGSPKIPALEDVDTAAGVEEPVANFSPWLYAGLGVAGVFMGGWFWRARVGRIRG